MSRRRNEELHAGWATGVAVPARAESHINASLTRVATPRVLLPASRKDQIGGATREEARGDDYPLAWARRIVDVFTRWLRRGWSPSSLTRVAEELCSRSHAGEAARGPLPTRMKKECRRRSNAGKATRVGADRLDPSRDFTLVEF